MIDGVIVKPLKKIQENSGWFLPMLSSTTEDFRGFGEIYFSLVYPGIVKGWHLHKEMILNYAVLLGKIKMVLYDDRSNSKTKGEVMKLFLDETNYCLIQVPNLVWTGFQGISKPYSIVANCSSIPHFENEIIRSSPFKKEIPYDWKIYG